jgi:hypothetical protein
VANPVIKTIIVTALGGALGCAGGIYETGTLIINSTTINASITGQLELLLHYTLNNLQRQRSKMTKVENRN